MAFLESPRFPDEIAFWLRGGRGFKTSIVETWSGAEFRNSAWSQTRGEWDIGEALRSMNPSSSYYGSALRDFFMIARGQLNAFRLKDFTDYKVGSGAGGGGSGVFATLTSTTFQMYKRYTVGSTTFDQIIQKPVASTVVVTGGVSPVVDYTTGIVTVASGTPTSWAGEFDVPVRFGGDMPKRGPTTEGALLSWEGVRLVEVRNP